MTNDERYAAYLASPLGIDNSDPPNPLKAGRSDGELPLVPNPAGNVYKCGHCAWLLLSHGSWPRFYEYLYCYNAECPQYNVVVVV